MKVLSVEVQEALFENLTFTKTKESFDVLVVASKSESFLSLIIDVLQTSNKSVASLRESVDNIL